MFQKLKKKPDSTSMGMAIRAKAGGLKRFLLRRRRKRTYVAVALAVILVAGIGEFTFMKVQGKSADAEDSVQSATAETGTISTTVTGTGTVAAGDTTDVSVLDGVTIKNVYVESGDTVKKGQKLATVDKASVASALLDVRERIDDVEGEIDDISGDISDEDSEAYLTYEVLHSELSELKAAKKSLTKMLKSGKITSPDDGIVSEVATSSTGADASQQTTEADEASTSADSSTALTQLSTKKSSYQIVPLSTSADSEDADADLTPIESCSLTVAAPETGTVPQSTLSLGPECTGTISWNCSTETFQADTVYTATIELVAADGYAFSDSIIPKVTNATVAYQVIEDSNGKSTLLIQAKFAKTAAAETSSQEQTDQTKQSETTTTEKQSSSAAGKTDGSGSQAASAAGNASDSSALSKASSGASGGSASTGGSASSSLSGSSGASSGSSSASSDSSDSSGDSSSLDETTVFSIASGDTVSIAISVDELDILSLEEGQAAAITLDALEEQQFEGSIANISRVASESSGSVKYTAEIETKKTDDMLIGMSASAVIKVEEAQDVVLIPTDALQERGNRSFVYTEKDSDGNLSGETEVSTGLSDGSNVEITSGIEEGTTVYYLKSGDGDSQDSDSNPEMNGPGGFGGERPSGDMPQGMGSGGDRQGGMGGGGQQ